MKSSYNTSSYNTSSYNTSSYNTSSYNTMKLVTLFAFIGFFLFLSVNVFAYTNSTRITTNITGGMDTFCDAFDPNNALGSTNNQFLAVKRGGVQTFRTYVKFNVSEIPLNAQVESAELFLFHTGTNANDNASAWFVNNGDDWDELTMTWNNQPCGTDQTLFNSSCPEHVIRYVGFDDFNTSWKRLNITDIVRLKLNNAARLISVAVGQEVPSDNKETDMRPKEFDGGYGLGGVAPYIVVNYTPTTPVTPCSNNYIETECLVTLDNYGTAFCEPPRITIPNNATNVTVEQRTIITPLNSMSGTKIFSKQSCSPSFTLPNASCSGVDQDCTSSNINTPFITQNFGYVAGDVASGSSYAKIPQGCIVSDTGFEMLGKLYVFYCAFNQTNQSYTYKNLEITANKPECGIFSPTLGNYTYSYGTNTTLNVYPNSCTFNFWKITNSSGNITTITDNRFNLYMNDSYVVKAWFDVTTPPENQQPSEVGGGTAFPENYNNFNWSFLNVFTSGYFIAMIINLALAGMVGYATKNSNYAISTFLLFFLVFLFGGVYPAFLWIPIIAITSIIIVMMVMKIGTGE